MTDGWRHLLAHPMISFVFLLSNQVIVVYYLQKTKMCVLTLVTFTMVNLLGAYGEQWPLVVGKIELQICHIIKYSKIEPSVLWTAWSIESSYGILLTFERAVSRRWFLPSNTHRNTTTCITHTHIYIHKARYRTIRTPNKVVFDVYFSIGCEMHFVYSMVFSNWILVTAVNDFFYRMRIFKIVDVVPMFPKPIHWFTHTHALLHRHCTQSSLMFPNCAFFYSLRQLSREFPINFLCNSRLHNGMFMLITPEWNGKRDN